MQNTDIGYIPVDYDYESIKRRIDAAIIRNERNKKIMFANEYIGRCVSRFRDANESAPRSSLENNLQSTIALWQSNEVRSVLAGLMLLCSVCWIGNALYSEFAEQQEDVFVQKCSANNLKHLRDNICYDNDRHIQTIGPDGTVKKGAMDWNMLRDTGFADKVANIKKAD